MDYFDLDFPFFWKIWLESQKKEWILIFYGIFDATKLYFLNKNRFGHCACGF